MIDKQVLYARIQEIEDSISRLGEIWKSGKDTFLKDKDLQDISCYRLLVMIEASIAICSHLCAKEIHKAPNSYAGCFAILEENGIIDEILSSKLQRMARFRNMLVHIYWDVDYALVWEIICQSLTDVREYISSIVQRYLSQP